MTIQEIHRSVKIALDKSDSLSYTSFLPEELDYWINTAIRQFVKTRFTGNNPIRSGFEQSQKRIDDLRTLLSQAKIETGSLSSVLNQYNTRSSELPTDYWFTVSEDVELIYPDVTKTKYYAGNVIPRSNSVYYCVFDDYITINLTEYAPGSVIRIQTNTGANSFTGNGYIQQFNTINKANIKETSSDQISAQMENPFSDHIWHYNYAKPLRIMYDNYVHLITDGNYHVRYYYLKYIRKPEQVSYYTAPVYSGSIEHGITYKVVGASVNYNSVDYTNGQTFVGDGDIPTFISTNNAPVYSLINTDLPEHSHDEIVKLTITLITESLGDTQRYQTSTIETSKME